MAATSNLRHSQSARPTSPHTPQQQLRSGGTSFASTTSPGSSFRNEDDAIIFEIGARWIRAGFEGNSAPACVVGFGPEEARRVGDYRGYIEGDSGARRPSEPIPVEDWSREFELWRSDLREIDMGLIEDKLERAFRDIYHQYLLTDAGTSRLVLVLPSLMPHPLLSALLSTLFSRWRFPSITLLPSAPMSATSAGLRSALVVDIGWEETTTTALYEFREVATKRSTRAMRAVLQELGRKMGDLTPKGDQADVAANAMTVGFKYCEEIACRLCWCPDIQNEQPDYSNQKTSIPSPMNPQQEYIDMAFSEFAKPVEKVLLALDIPETELDDEEKSVPLLIYRTLLELPPDARGTCMSRVVFVGGGSRIPGLRQRILKEVSILVDRYGWSPIRGKVLERQRERLEQLRISTRTNGDQSPVNDSPSTPDSAAPDTTTPDAATPDEKKPHPSQQEPEVDFVEQKLRRQNKDTQPPIQGVLREVESLGAWAGASLTTSLKVRGMVEIEREKFLQYGLAGGSRESEHPVPDRRSGLRAGDRSSWTLAGWA